MSHNKSSTANDPGVTPVVLAVPGEHVVQHHLDSYGVAFQQQIE
jgi:hypothetical protein